MSIAEFFGDVVNKNFKKKPGFTRGFIKTGYAVQNYLLKRKPKEEFLPSQQYLTQISMQSILRALRKPKNSALVNIFTPCELLHAMDLNPLCAEGFSSYLTGGYSEKGFLEYAEQRGVPETFCSYHKALIGAAESGILPKPRCMITTSTVCDANISSFRRIAAHFSMQEFILDVPHSCSEDAVQYVAGQIKNLASYLEEVMHKKMQPERLAQAISNTNQSLSFYRAFLDELAEKYFPTSITLQMFNLISTHILMGTPETRHFYELQLADIRQCRPSDARRIIWSHVLPYYSNVLQETFDFNPDIHLLINDLSFDSLQEISPENPFPDMARRLINNTLNGNFERKIDSVLAMSKKLHAKAAVCFCQWGCKQSTGGAYLLKQALEQEGIPSLILDGDACDRRNAHPEQMRTRLDAFFEMLENKQ